MISELSFDNETINSLIEKYGKYLSDVFIPKTIEEIHWMLGISIKKYYINHITIQQIQELERKGWINHGYYIPYLNNNDPLYKLRLNKKYELHYITVYTAKTWFYLYFLLSKSNKIKLQK